MLRTISRTISLFAVILGFCASGLPAQAQLTALVSWGTDLDGVVSGTPATGAYSAIASGYQHIVALRTNGTLVS